jgi:hypothetical protein
MLNLGLGIKNRSGGGGGGGSMAATFMETLGIANDSTTYNTGTAYELTGSELWTAISDLSTVIEDNDLQDKIVCLHPYIAGTSTYHKYNLIDPTAFELTFYGGFTHDGRGIVPNGTNAYADTGVSASDMVLDSTGMNFYSRTEKFGENYAAQAMGMNDDIGGLGNIEYLPQYLWQNRRSLRLNSTAFFQFLGITTTLRNQWTQRINSTTIEAYEDKVSLGTRTAASTGIALRNFYYCASSYAATGALGYSDYNHALTMIMKGVFTTEEREALTDAISDFQLAMKRNV